MYTMCHLVFCVQAVSLQGSGLTHLVFCVQAVSLQGSGLTADNQQLPLRPGLLLSCNTSVIIKTQLTFNSLYS